MCQVTRSQEMEVDTYIRYGYYMYPAVDRFTALLSTPPTGTVQLHA
jgi:hypothetical protein